MSTLLTREVEYDKVRELLDNPKEQRPNPRSIISALIRQEQFMVNKLGNTRRAWTTASLTVTSVVGQSDYVITPSHTNNSFGKALFVYRNSGGNIIVPVPFTDYIGNHQAQSFDTVTLPFETKESPLTRGESIAFYRTGGGAIFARIFPAPTDVRSYEIVYATGLLDWTSFDWSDIPLMPEWSDFRTHAVALGLLVKCEWIGYSKAENVEKRGELKESLGIEFGMHLDEFNQYIKNTQHEGIDFLGAWYEDE